MSRRAVLVGVAVIGVLLVLLALSDPTEDRYHRPRLDPRGTGPDGTAALVEVLELQGADVRIGLPSEGDEVVLLMEDTLGGTPSDDLDEWVRAGGTLVVTDAGSQFAAPTASSPTAFGQASRPGDCTVGALADLGTVSPPLPMTLEAPPGSSWCFADGGGGAGLVLQERGAGLIATLTWPEPFTNARLDQDDNAGLAARLLVPWPGVDVRIIDPTRLYGTTDDVGDGTVLGALPQRFQDAVGQLIIAFLAWGLIRGRRLGRPVDEELPVPLPASDLVLASGRLLDRNGDATDAAERLRRRARRDLGIALGLGSDPDPGELADALHGRAGIDPVLIRSALLVPVVDQSDLVATSSYLDRLRRELTP